MASSRRATPQTATGASSARADPEIGPHLEDQVTLSEVARALASLRVTRGSSQGDLARAAGIHKSAISEYERGKKMPALSTIVRLLAALGYTIEDLHAALAFVRGRDHAERLPANGGLDPEAHRLAATAARATYDCWYAVLRDPRFAPPRREAKGSGAACLAVPETAPAEGAFQA
jgi:transcriptional regulator with XRE-family HTH domain